VLARSEPRFKRADDFSSRIHRGNPPL
jgi:hypothetical protein